MKTIIKPLTLLFVTLLSLGGCGSPPRPDLPWHLFDSGSVDTFPSRWWGEGTTDPASYQAKTFDQLAEEGITDYYDVRASSRQHVAEFKARREASMENVLAHWRVETDPATGIPELVNDGEGLYLTTVLDFADFELSLEYKTVAGADSGVYLRGVPQVQIWDTTEAGGKWDIGADKGSGGLWNNSPGTPGKDPLVHADKPFGEWNTLRVRMEGEIVSVWLNDQLVVDDAVMENYFDRSKPVPRSGPIQLQTHGGEIRWRNITITELNMGYCGTGLVMERRRKSWWPF